MRCPSVKTLLTIPNVTRSEARIIRELMRGELRPTLFYDAKLADLQSVHRHNQDHLIMLAIDTVLDTHGVEYLSEDEHDTGAPYWEYCNTGETYNATVIRYSESGHYSVGSWGDIVERNDL